MANKEFILQGFTTRTHADAVRELFDIPDIEHVILSVAFVSESGVEEIEGQLTANAACVSIFAGIRNDGSGSDWIERCIIVMNEEL